MKTRTTMDGQRTQSAEQVSPHVVIGKTRPARRIKWPVIAVISAALILLLTVLFIALSFLTGSRDTSSVEMSKSDLSFPAPPPAEWEQTALWKSPPLLPEAGRALVVQSARVVMVTAQRKVVLVDAATGDTRWSADLGDGQVHTALNSTQIDGTNVIAAHVGNKLRWWSILDGSSRDIDVPDNASVTFYAAAPLVGTSASTVATVADDKLHQISVPQGATALGARADGIVTATSLGGWWHLQAGKTAGPVTPWEYASPKPVQLSPVAECGNVVVAVKASTAAAGQATVVLYSDRPTDVRWLTQAPMRLDTEQVAWRCSTSKTWGILARTLIDFRSGSVTDLGPWTTTQIASDRALGRVGDQRVVAGPAIPPGVLPADEGFPDDLVKIENAQVAALVRAQAGPGAQPVIYLLPPRK